MPPAFHKGTFQQVKVKNGKKKNPTATKINSRIVNLKILKIICGTLTKCRTFYH